MLTTTSGDNFERDCSRGRTVCLNYVRMPMQVGDGVFEVLSTSGDTHLGGDDFDRRIVDFMSDDFKRNEVFKPAL